MHQSIDRIFALVVALYSRFGESGGAKCEKRDVEKERTDEMGKVEGEE